MFESENAFLSGSALEALSQWSDALKSFQSRIGQHFARLEARQSARRIFHIKPVISAISPNAPAFLRSVFALNSA